jgi:putative membrane protein
MMDGWHDGMGAGGWVLMTFLWVALVALIVWAAAQLFSRDDRPRRAAGERPEEVLDRRLASGEIDESTYDRLQTKLRDARRVT